ncbi:hypothetical protein [Streptomyces violaceusniger]|uniref:hypothetical protein n=1 Tax=Streptomyces violaceusniger TaxID=68280 RepID=UPI0036C585F7
MYDALNTFQQTADWPQLRLAQMRHHLAEHIAKEVAFTPRIGQAHPESKRWRVEILDGEEWLPGGTAFTNRAEAVAHRQDLDARTPRWADGTPVRRRIVQETTQYTVKEA